MRNILPKSIFDLAEKSTAPVYAVGGIVRDFLLGFTPLSQNPDFDICAPMPVDEFLNLAISQGFQVKSVYKNTGTVKLQDQNGLDFEYSHFRSDKYVRGIHAPIESVFTTEIEKDCIRRDFTINAIYYDLKNEKFVDPLNGISAIQDKRLTTVTDAQKVFSEDGLRLMRLARFAGQLGFSPDEECLLGAKAHAHLIKDISAERIYAELVAILRADEKFGVKGGQYHGLCVLDQTGVLDHVFPELTLGRHMAQRPDFHKYDVLEHSLRAVLYAPPQIRLAALLHDVGKPFCKIRDNNSYAHPQEGARIATEILQRLKAPKKVILHTARLIENHMYDFNCQTKESKLRRYLVANADILPDLLLVKQADFSACMDDCSLAPTCTRWQTLLKKMKDENVPFHVRELAISGKELLDLPLPPNMISQTLERLLAHTAVYPKDNQKSILLKLAKGK